ncbi:M16 family metallopeptidase [Devosia sp. SL43]|uniref:M16 family metallopeptidase n=1 Tax=Devosia sp. SL43 TaxID=2806348 RepID=UPI001F1B1692|nr:pitrilysin family protein [Devosia sp. SL43]UJW86775.1 insulinase family protein [Devosia sp. SL43]
MTFRTMLALATTIALAAPALAQDAVQGDTAAIEHFALDNGLEVVVIPDHRAPIVTHMVWYKVGSADEAPGKSGIAHFFEHLMFKGTAKHPGGELDRVVYELGGTGNAFTSYDYTAYYQIVPPEALATMMDFEADRMRGLILSEDVIGAERDVVLEERRMRIEGSPQALLGEETSATLFQNHPYRIPTIGWMHEMEQLNRADAVAFYDQYYAPNNAILVVAGDVDPADVRTLAEASYGLVPRGPTLPPRIRPSEPEHNTARTVTLSDPRVGIASFSRSWVVPSYRSAEPGEAEALDLLSEILGGGMRSRFYQQIVVKSGIGSNAGAGYNGGSYDASQFAIYGAPQSGKTLADVETAVDAQVALLIKDGVTPEELDAAKARFVRSLIFARDAQEGLANLYGSVLATGGTIEDIDAWPDRIRAVTPEQVQAVAAKYLDPSIAVTSYLLPSPTGAQ